MMNAPLPKFAELSPRQKHDVDKGRRVIERMLGMGQELRKRDVLMAQFKDFGLAINPWPWLAPYQDWFNASAFGLLQTPSEYVDYLLYIADKEPETYMEIGIYSGGNALFTTAFFQALNPNFRFVGLDLNNRLILDAEIIKPLNIEFRIGKTSEDCVDEQFDVVFIDGHHSYNWAKRDYLNLGRHARKICAFHDVNSKEYRPQGGGVYTFWRQLRQSLSGNTAMLEIAHAYPGAGKENDAMWMGIGILDYTR